MFSGSGNTERLVGILSAAILSSMPSVWNCYPVELTNNLLYVMSFERVLWALHFHVPPIVYTPVHADYSVYSLYHTSVWYKSIIISGYLINWHSINSFTGNEHCKWINLPNEVAQTKEFFVPPKLEQQNSKSNTKIACDQLGLRANSSKMLVKSLQYVRFKLKNNGIKIR